MLWLELFFGTLALSKIYDDAFRNWSLRQRAQVSTVCIIIKALAVLRSPHPHCTFTVQYNTLSGLDVVVQLVFSICLRLAAKTLSVLRKLSDTYILAVDCDSELPGSSRPHYLS